MPRVTAKPMQMTDSTPAEMPETEGPNGSTPISEPLESPQPLPEEASEGKNLPAAPHARSKVTPLPEFYKFHTDNPRGRRPNDFFAYWVGLPMEFRERLTAYVYRNWPVIQVMVPDKKKGGLRPSTQIAKLPGEDPIRDEDHLMRIKGSGDYTIRLNDATVRKSIALCIIKGLRNEDHPPVIDSYDQLVMDDPANQSFIEGLRQRGVFPGDNEMAASEMTSALTGTIDRLTEKLTEKDRQPAPAAASQTPAEVTMKTLDMAGKAFDQGVNLAKETLAAQTEAKVAAARAEASMGQQNPGQAIDMFEKVAGVIAKLQPAAANAPAAQPGEMLKELTGIFTTFMDREQKLQGTIMALQSTRMEALEKQVQALLSNPATPATQKDDLAAGLDRLLALKDKILALSSSKEEEAEVREPRLPPWMHLAQTALNVLPNTAASMVAMSHNLAVARTGQGEPIAAGIIETETPALPAPNPNPTPGGSPMQLDAITLNFLRAIERPLINHLNDPQKTGADFAAWVSDGYGEIGYQAAREKGKDGLMKMLLSYRPIAEVIQQIPERSLQFIDEFLTADDSEEPPAEEPGRSFVAPAEGAAQVVDVPPVVLAQEAARKKRAKAAV